MGHRVDAKYVDANGVTREAGYIARGLNVNRSFTVVDGLVHNIENEITPKEYISTMTAEDNSGFQSAAYSGFFYASNATNVTFKNCTLTGRRYYSVQGTYDFGANTVNKIVLDGCVQQNFWVVYDEQADEIRPATRETAGVLPSMASITVDGKSMKMHWGLGGTNFCKNMEYLNSTLSRFDAHSGLYNGKVINSTVNYLALTGNGEFIVENVDWYSEGTGHNSASIFHLRSDYGSTWEGDIKVKNLRAYIHEDSESYLFLHTYNNWYYGYKAHMPNLDIDNLDYYNIKTYQPVEAGHEILLMQKSTVNEPAMHLYTTQNYEATYPYVDNDNDGYVDNTTVEYAASLVTDKRGGVSVAGNNTNLNPIGVPDYIRIVNNDGVDGTGGYIFNIPKTHGASDTYNPDETPEVGVALDGGFFGRTKFIYGTGENDFYRGTNHTGTQTFAFK